MKIGHFKHHFKKENHFSQQPQILFLGQGPGPNGEQIGQYGPNGEYPGSAGFGLNNQIGNQQRVDYAIGGCFKAFNIRPTGNKSADMLNLMGNMMQTAFTNNITPQQDQSIAMLMDQLGVQKSGNKNADLIVMLCALMQGGQQQNNTGFIA